MSEVESDTPVQGSWLAAWFAGAAVPALIGSVGIMAMIGIFTARAGAALEAWMYLTGFANIFVYAALVAALTAAMLIGPMILAESRRARPLGLWLVVGLIASGPAIMMAWLISNIRFDAMGTPPPALQETLPVPLFFCLLGLIGAAIAFRVRHGSWR